MAGGLIVSLALWRIIGHWEVQALRSEVDARAAAKARLLDASVRQSMHVLYGISSLIAAQSTTAGDNGPGITREQFRLFVAQALARQPELQAIGWTPRVTRNHRESFERAARADGLAGFEFRQLDAGGRSVRAPDRDEYYPVYYLEPQADNAPALGFELDSDPARMAALRNAASTGLPTATAPLQLVQKPHAGVGFVVYLPVYAAASNTPVPPDPDSLVGYASAVFRIEPLITRVETGLAEEGLTLTVTDDSAGRRLFGATEADEFTGVSALPLAGRNWSLALHPTPAFIAHHRHSESGVVLGSGIVITLLLSAYIRSGVRQRAVIEQKVDERTRQLQQAEAKARAIFEHAVEGMFQTTVDGRYLSANPALACIYGYASPAELMSQLADVDELYVDPGRRKEFVRLVQEHGVVMDFESQARRKDGQVIWISENARAAVDERGAMYFEGSVVDISDRKHAEQVLRADREALEARVRERTVELDEAVSALRGEVAERTRAQADAAAASQAKSRFLANVSHEIRTPMNAILGYAQLLGGDANLTSGQREAMATILSSGRHLLELIDDVLDLSKIEAGRSEVQAAAFSLVDVLREVGSLFAGRCSEKGLLLRIDAADSDQWPACVWGDSRKLRQVLINLLGNAVKFTDEGGVTLRVDRPTDTRYRFEVADTGIGIQPEALSAIFEPFRQASSGAIRGGTGLGLAIARGQIEVMGGRLGVQSTPSLGSRFDFELELPATVVEADLPKRLSRVLTPGRSLRVLVVDDVAESRRVVGALLRRIGCQVAESPSIAEAVKLAMSFEPDLAVVDLIMPGIDGFAGAPMLAAAFPSRTRLLAMSASATPETRARCEQSGFHAFLAKPIELDRLAMTIARAAGVSLETVEDETPATPRHTAASLDDLVPSLRRRIVRAARRCSVTDLKNCLAEAEASGPPGAAALLRRGLRSYDMELIVRTLDEVPGVDEEEH